METMMHSQQGGNLIASTAPKEFVSLKMHLTRRRLFCLVRDLVARNGLQSR
jgi:hypothetical protein